MNPSPAHADLVAAYRRAEADAAHKFGLIQGVAKKGPKAIQTAIETAAKAAKRRDAYAKKLAALGVGLGGLSGDQLGCVPEQPASGESHSDTPL